MVHEYEVKLPKNCPLHVYAVWYFMHQMVKIDALMLDCSIRVFSV